MKYELQETFFKNYLQKYALDLKCQNQRQVQKQGTTAAYKFCELFEDENRINLFKEKNPNINYRYTILIIIIQCDNL